jgi:hypothetical protein
MARRTLHAERLNDLHRASGFTGRSRSRASVDLKRSSRFSISYGRLYQASCASTSTDPQPGRAKSLYMPGSLHS